MAKTTQSDWFIAVASNLGYGIYQAFAGTFPGWPIFLGASAISVLFCVFVVFPFLDYVFGNETAMKSRLIALLLVLALFATACSDTKVLDGREYDTYGLFNEDEVKAPHVRYKLVVGNVVWSVLLAETIVAPLKKRTDDAECSARR